MNNRLLYQQTHAVESKEEGLCHTQWAVILFKKRARAGEKEGGGGRVGTVYPKETKPLDVSAMS